MVIRFHSIYHSYHIGVANSFKDGDLVLDVVQLVVADSSALHDLNGYHLASVLVLSHVNLRIMTFSNLVEKYIGSNLLHSY